mmetsp:Transcript_21895/g.43045  ORF Transcript_21895/g.43045 Transcript_21895/m.43045 type:complete len:213 (-) Transcript_21895:583-1221(-)
MKRHSGSHACGLPWPATRIALLVLGVGRLGLVLLGSSTYLSEASFEHAREDSLDDFVGEEEFLVSHLFVLHLFIHFRCEDSLEQLSIVKDQWQRTTHWESMRFTYGEGQAIVARSEKSFGLDLLKKSVGTSKRTEVSGNHKAKVFRPIMPTIELGQPLCCEASNGLYSANRNAGPHTGHCTLPIILLNASSGPSLHAVFLQDYLALRLNIRF